MGIQAMFEMSDEDSEMSAEGILLDTMNFQHVSFFPPALEFFCIRMGPRGQESYSRDETDVREGILDPG